MSGVRAHNPELTALGLTLPGFVERNHVIASLPSLGLLTLAGLTPASIDTRYLEVPDIADVPGVPEEFDVVAISSFSAQIKEAYALADRYRALGTKVILGGLHVSAVPGEARHHADAIVIGEGETVWPQVMADLESGGRLHEIYDSRDTNFDFSHSPMPRFDLLDPERYNRLTVQTQRGCPFRCEFCAASIRISPVYKTKPVERVVAEIREIKSLWKRPFIEFADDNTFVNKTHGKQMVRALAREEIRWFTETDISVADDLELLDLMKDSGCAQVLIGLESTSFSSLDGVEQKANWKARQVDRYLEAIRRIQDRGITVNGCFVLGLDTTGQESFEDIWEFVQESGLYEVQITVQTAHSRSCGLAARRSRHRRCGLGPKDGLAFISNGEGNITVIQEKSANSFVALDPVQTQQSAKSAAFDPRPARSSSRLQRWSLSPRLIRFRSQRSP
jgi:radical SAM superfamily enzyme YgiQ (UPF0313 family)